MKDKLLPGNKWSRPRIPLPKVAGVVLHWVQWPQASAQMVRDYFAEGVPSEQRYASAHYVVGLSGDIIRMIPEDEVAYHAGPSNETKPETERLLDGKPNWRTIGIEMCHMTPWGEFEPRTVNSAVWLTADICARYDLDPTIFTMRHYDCTGKDCPRWWVQNPGEWFGFQNRVLHQMRSEALK